MMKAQLKILKQLSFRQIKIFIVAAAMMITFYIIWNYVYIPVKKDFKKNSEELVSVSQRVKAVEGFIPMGETTGEQIKKMKADLEALTKKLPTDEEESLNMFTEFMRQLDIRVESTNISNRKFLLDDQNTKMIVDGQNVEILLITFRLKSDYEGVVRLITQMRESIPAFVSVERVTIDAAREENEKLSVILDVNMYLLAKK